MKKQITILVILLIIILAGVLLYLMNQRETSPKKQQQSPVQVDQRIPSDHPSKPKMTVVNNDFILLPRNDDDTIPEPFKNIVDPGILEGADTVCLTRGTSYNDVPQAEFVLLERDSEGKLIPWKQCKQEGWRINIDSSVTAPHFPKYGYVDLEQVYGQKYRVINKSGLPVSGEEFLFTKFRCAVLPSDYAPTDKNHITSVLRLGGEYQFEFRVKNKTVGRCEIKIPKTIERGKVVRYEVVANEFWPPKTPPPKKYTIQVKWTDEIPKVGLQAFLLTEAGKLSKTSSMKDGMFTFTSLVPLKKVKMLFIAENIASGKLLAMKENFEKENLEFPKDADFTADKKNMISVNVQIPDNFVPNSSKRAMYMLTPYHKLIWLKPSMIFSYHRNKIYSREMEEFKKTKNIKLEYIPGKYSIYGWLGDGNEVVHVGDIMITKDDNGKYVKLIPAKEKVIN